MDDVERIDRFTRWFFETTSTRTERTRFGTAYFNDEYRVRYSANLLLADHVGLATPQEFAAELDRLLARFEHRKAIVSDDDGTRLAAGMRDLGYVADRTATMVLRGEPDRAPHLELVEEIDHASRRAFLKELYPHDTPGVSDVLLEFSGWLERSIGARFFVQRIDGRIAGTCELYVHGDMAQVESVDTLEGFRGRGVARNIVLRAAAEGRAAGAEMVFIEADANDWPQRLYERLGFRHVGAYREFLRSSIAAPPPAEPA
jgi:ribosomal protein S18 acetylase RimI-like enzyme